MKTHIAKLFSADLKESQMTFDIQEPMVVKSGIYAIVPIDDYKKLVNGTDKQPEKALAIQGVMPSIYVVTYNDDYGRPIFDNCFNDLKIAKEYVNDHDYLRMDSTTVIKEIDFE